MHVSAAREKAPAVLAVVQALEDEGQAVIGELTQGRLLADDPSICEIGLLKCSLIDSSGIELMNEVRAWNTQQWV